MNSRAFATLCVLAAGIGPGWVLADPLPSNTTGCAAGSRCIRVTGAGRPSNSGVYVAQCRGKFPDFIAHSGAIPAGSSGKRFTPELVENATTQGPTTTRPWRNFDPRIPAERLGYLLALRNYAFSSSPVRSFTPQLTATTAYRDPAGGTVPSGQVSQRWYPAPLMIYGAPGTVGVREPTFGMTLERTVDSGELANNLNDFRNYAVAYYDRRGSRTYRNVWLASPPGRNVADLTKMGVAVDSLVFKLLFSAATANDFPQGQDILNGSLSVNILPNNNTTTLAVRLLQIDIAVRDERAGVTGWYFATYVYDRTVSSTSVWRKMVPLGLMWGNDPGATTSLVQSWINPAAPAYAKAHLGVGGRLNGPVDNPDSACMSCHSTAQSPSVARMVPEGGCAPLASNWFRNLAGNVAFGRFTQSSSSCATTPQPPAPVAADYSLQLASTVSRSLANNTFNPCTWDTDSPPTAGASTTLGVSPAAGAADEAAPAAEFETDGEVPVYEIKR